MASRQTKPYSKSNTRTRSYYKPQTSYTRRPYVRPYRNYKSSKAITMGGRGAYYIKGRVGASAKVPYFGKFDASLGAGYASGNTSFLKGLGSYSLSNIKHNVLIKPDIPQIRNTVYTEGGTIIRHREYLGPIVTSATAGQFDITSYPLNPAQSSTFPWLSQLAANYEEYKPNGLMFEFRSTASDAIASSTNLALGQVMMCTQYDPTDPEFSSDIELLNYSWAQSGKVSDNVQHFVECDPKQSPLSHLYTRAGSESSPSDLRFSDFGRFSIATQGLQGTSVQIGQLWVTYEFIMYKPKLGEDQAEGGGIFMYQNRSGSVTSAVIWGNPLSGGDFWQGNNIDITLGYIQNNEPTITFPPSSVGRTYSVQITLSGDSTASVVPFSVTSVGANINRFLNVDDNVVNVLQPSSASTSTYRSYSTLITVGPADNISGNLIRLNSAGVSPANPVAAVLITEVKYIDPSAYPNL